MSVPFKYKQLYRELYDYLTNSKSALQSNDFDLFLRMLDPKAPPALVATYTAKLPLDQETFLSFIAESQKATAEPYETILWKYVAKAVQYNLLAGEESIALKDWRAMIDSGLKRHKNDAELTALYNAACPAAADKAATANITATELSAFLQGLGKTVPLFDVLRTLLPKKRGGKTTSVDPPQLTGGSSASAPAPQPPAETPKPYTDAAPPKPATPAPAVAIPAKVEAPAVVSAPIQETPPPPPPVAEEVTSLPESPNTVPPPPPADDPAVSASGTGSFGGGGAAASSISVGSTAASMRNRAMTTLQQPSAINNRHQSAFEPSSPATASDKPSGRIQGDAPATQRASQQQDTVAPPSAPAPAAAAASSAAIISPELQKLLNEQQAAVSLFPHHNEAVAGGILPLPNLPTEVITYVSELDRQRQLLLERLETETAQLNDANAAVAVLKNRIKQLSSANAAYFAAATLGHQSDAKAFENLSPADQLLLNSAKAEASGLDPYEAAALSPFYQLQVNRARLQKRMEEWLEHAKSHNDFLRQEVLLAREGYRYDKSSAALAAHREAEERHYWASQRGSQSPRAHAPPPAAIAAAGQARNIGGFTVATVPEGFVPTSANGGSVAPAQPTGAVVGAANDVMSPYRIARFYNEMAKKDKELEEKQRLLHAMNAIEAREQQLSAEIAALQQGPQSINNAPYSSTSTRASPPAGALPFQNSAMSIVREDRNGSSSIAAPSPLAFNGDGNAMRQSIGGNLYNPPLQQQQQGGSIAPPDHIFYNVSASLNPRYQSIAAMSASQRYEQANSVARGPSPSLPSAYNSDGIHFQRKDPQILAREQQRRYAIEQLALQQQQQLYPAAGRGGIVGNVEQYITQQQRAPGPLRR